jgi:MscS family membrane protein
MQCTYQVSRLGLGIMWAFLVLLAVAMVATPALAQDAPDVVGLDSAMVDGEFAVDPVTGELLAVAEPTLPIRQFVDRFATGKVMLENDLTQWIALFLVLLLSLVIGKAVSFGLEKHAQHLNDTPGWQTLEVVVRAVHRPVMLMLFAGALAFGRRFMNLDFHVGDDQIMHAGPAWDQTVVVLFSVSVGWLMYRLVDVVEHVLSRFAERTDTLLDDQLVPLVRKSLRIFVVIVAALYIARKAFNADIKAMVAGLGIGGLAFAFAAKDALGNLFGSFMILADKPFRIGDRVTINGTTGNVEEVGFRSTRLRTLDGHLTTIPNGLVANVATENVSKRPTLKRVINVTITYDTAPKMVQRAVDILNEMLETRKENFDPENLYKVFFNDFNAESLNIVVYYWFAPAEWWDYLAFNQDFNLELLTRFNDEGIEFAFPTQTVYLKSDGDIKADLDLRNDASK